MCKTETPISHLMRSGHVEGQQAMDILLDTGCSRTMVHKSLVPEQKLKEGEAVTIRCAHGDTVLYPLACVRLEVDGLHVPIIVDAAVSETLPTSVLLGTDVPELSTLLGAKTSVLQGEGQYEVMVVTTRAEAARRKEEEILVQEREAQSMVNPRPMSECGADGDTTRPTQVTQEQQRHIRRALSKSTPQNDGSFKILDLMSEEVQELQEKDDSLSEIRRLAVEGLEPGNQKFFKREGLFFRRWTPPGGGRELEIEQLVVPQQCRGAILKLAHEVPTAGHLGREKTIQRVLRRFYWPTVFADIRKFCSNCGICQKTSQRGPKKVPLIPLPIISEPFSRIAMDIVGPLPKSRSGNKYILVICDYATRYPEAIPLRTIDAEHVAEELIKLFARVGVPQEILTDQGSNFTSQLLAEIYRLLHVHAIRTSPYHPQTDGLVERFNQTLKNMIRRTTTKEGKDWDKMIPYLLFAYREVPQASTGFSPFELLYGREVRGPLDVLRDQWEARQRSDESVVSYVLKMRERLQEMSDVVRENLAVSQAMQKKWYDHKARFREFNVGDQVLVMLPTSSNKLLAQWQGPYQVTQRSGRVTYVVDMHDRKKRKRLFHVNMLKKFNTQATGESYYSAVPEDDEAGDIPYWKSDSHRESTFGDQLQSDQLKELEGLLRQYRTVFSGKPGRTDLTEHQIWTENARPIRLPPYRLPQAYRRSVKEELDEMLENGIIEPSRSEWSFPVVLVPKKDGSLRMCVDYRRLNSVSKVDNYPMPRVEELIDRLGNAKYISTMDLTKGYWQVPVAKEDQHKTAFVTPFGLYQYKMMPFGLSGAPASFQRLMDHLIRGCQEFAAAYLDDLIIFSATWEEHLQHLGEILERLKQANLTAKPGKCQFGMSDCVYLGHRVGGGSVQPEVSKLDAVESFPTPTTKKDVRAFLGLTGYYRRFIPNFASISASLSDLTKKRCPNLVNWNAKCEEALGHLKKALCSRPVLHSPDFTKQFVLQTDASDRGVGAVLSQQDDMGEEHPIAYFSRKLLPREERYSTIEKECLAIKLAVYTFRVYLLGRKFVIQTDHRSLEWLDRLKENNSRLCRWSLALQPFNFVVQYRKGTQNQNADALSRVPAN